MPACAGAWILRHLNGLRIFGLAIAALFLVFSGNLTGWSLLFIVIVLAVVPRIAPARRRLGPSESRQPLTSSVTS